MTKQDEVHCSSRPPLVAGVLHGTMAEAACSVSRRQRAGSPVQHVLHCRRLALHGPQAPPQIAPLLLGTLLARALLRRGSSARGLSQNMKQRLVFKRCEGLGSRKRFACERGMRTASLACARTFCSTSVASMAVTPKSSSTLSPPCCAMLRVDSRHSPIYLFMFAHLNMLHGMRPPRRSQG